MQMNTVNKPLQKISNVPRIFADVTTVLDGVGRVQFVENVEAETRLGAATKNPATNWSK
jgi:hypothetical protein